MNKSSVSIKDNRQEAVTAQVPVSEKGRGKRRPRKKGSKATPRELRLQAEKLMQQARDRERELVEEAGRAVKREMDRNWEGCDFEQFRKEMNRIFEGV